MLKYLTKLTQEIRVETEEAADTLHKEMAEWAENNGGVLTGWTETKKEQKSKGEVIAIWYICKSTIAFNDPKTPEIPFEELSYKASGVVPW